MKREEQTKWQERQKAHCLYRQGAEGKQHKTVDTSSGSSMRNHGTVLVNLGSNLFPHCTALKIHCTSVFSIRRWEEQSKLLCYTSVFCDYLEKFLLKKYNLYSSALLAISTHATTWMNLRPSVLSEICQSQKDTCGGIPLK